MTASKQRDQFRPALRRLNDLYKQHQAPPVRFELVEAARETIDRFDRAVTERSADIPTSDEIGIACFWLLMDAPEVGISDATERLVMTLLTPEIGVNLTASHSGVMAILKGNLDAEDRFIQELEALETPTTPRALSPLPDDSDIPF